MSVRIVYLGRLSEIAGRDESEFDSAPDGLDWAQLIVLLRDNVNLAISDAAANERTLVAVNGKVLSEKAALIAKHGDEVALLPPVSGG
ncbi:MAG: MoaD/ThiS family protein [Erythrobacter sp.]